MMDLNNDQIYEMLCQARDRLEVGPEDGPERSGLVRAYLDARKEAFKRAGVWQKDPLPSLNRRFLVLRLGSCLWADFIEDKTQPPYLFEGLGSGWAGVRALPPPRFVPQRHEDRDPDEAEQDDEILFALNVRGSPILSSKMLAIWRRLDAGALDVLPARVASHAGGAAERDYWVVDVVRVLPALDEARMGLRRFRAAAPPGADISKYVEYVPRVEAIALREDMPVSGVHLFRDEIDRERIFISAELARECYEAGAGSVLPIFDWPDQPNFGVDLKNLLQDR